MRVGIFHLSLNPCGGAEKLALILSKALKESGYTAELVLVERPDWGKIRRILGIGIEAIDKEIIIPPFCTFPTIYSRIVNWLLRDVFYATITKRKYDLTITTMPTFPLVLTDIIYIHFPDFIPDFLDVYQHKYVSGALRAYSLQFRLICSLFTKLFTRATYKPLILTNSKFTQQVIHKYLNVNPIVVYPPVNTLKFASLSQIEKRENIVLTISRIDDTKNLNVIPQIARYIKNCKFIILGSTYSYSKNCLLDIMREAERLGVRDRVLVFSNASENEKADLLSKAKIYLHTMKFEHFGMSIVEAMSSGLVPVVHKSGGPWIDIMQETQGAYGYAYESIDEAAALIAELLNNEVLRLELSKKATRRAKLFDSKMFEKRISRIVKCFVETKYLT